MGFLDGALSPLITAATQAVGGAQQGQHQGLIDKIKLDKQAKDDAIKAVLSGANLRHLNAETNHLESPPPKTPQFHFDQDGNAYTMGENGHLTPAIIDRPDTPPGQPATPPAATGGPSGDIDLSTHTANTQTSPATEQHAVAPPAAQQGTPKAPAPQPKFGPRPPLDPIEVHKKERLFDVANPVPEKTDRELVQVQGPDGNPIWTPRPEAAGKPAKVTTRLESATNTAATARLQAAVSEMNNAHKGMEEFEQGLKSGKYTINGMEQLGGRVANSFTHDDPISMGIQSTALAALNRTNPALARYIRRGLSFAEGESMISQRPSDFRTKMAAFLSTAASGASPEMIGDIESRRTSILNPLNETVGASKAPGGTADNARKAGSSSGDINLGTKQLVPLTTAQRVRAAKDSDYRDFKISQGYKF